jgi:hypothetical protein
LITSQNELLSYLKLIVTKLKLKDPRQTKEELTRLLEKEDSTEKLVKLVKSLILSLNASINASSSTPGASPLGSKQQQLLQQQQNQNQQNEINCVILLGMVVSKRPQLFIKQPSLTEV